MVRVAVAALGAAVGAVDRYIFTPYIAIDERGAIIPSAYKGQSTMQIEYCGPATDRHHLSTARKTAAMLSKLRGASVTLTTRGDHETLDQYVARVYPAGVEIYDEVGNLLRIHSHLAPLTLRNERCDRSVEWLSNKPHIGRGRAKLYEEWLRDRQRVDCRDVYEITTPGGFTAWLSATEWRVKE